MTLQRGLYEVLLTERLGGVLKDGELRLKSQFRDLHAADAADRIALHLSRVIERAIESLPEKVRARAGALWRANSSSNSSVERERRP